MLELEDALRLGEIAKPVLAEVEQRAVAGAVVAEQLLGGQRHDDLASVGDAHEARRLVDGGAVVVAVARFGVPGVDAHADTQRPGAVPPLARDRELRVARGSNRVGGIGERGVRAVAGHLHDMAVVGSDRLAEDLVVPGESVLHRLGVLLPQPCGPLEVREEKRDRAGRHLRHGCSPRSRSRARR